MKKAAFFLCVDPDIDYVSPNVLSFLKEKKLEELNLTVDGMRVLRETDNRGNFFDYVQTKEILFCKFKEYLPQLKQDFTDYDFIGVVNWHAGDNAPDCIITAHSTGDVTSGIFNPTNPVHLKNLLCAMENNRKKEALDSYRVMVEATHWGGVVYGQPKELLKEFQVPMYDIELGSTHIGYSSKTAAKVIAESLNQVFENFSDEAVALLYFGGVHFEQDCTNMMTDPTIPASFAHILPNYWISNDGYVDAAGFEKLEEAIESTVGEVRGIIFNDNLKGRYKQTCKAFAQDRNLLIGKHRVLRDKEQLQNFLKQK